MSKIPQSILNQVMDEAKRGDMRYLHGAGLVDSNGNLITYAHNKYVAVNASQLKEGPVHKGNKLSLHAEEIVLNNVKRRQINGAKLYVIRMSLQDPTKLICSKPCLRCTKILNKFITKYGLKVVYYS